MTHIIGHLVAATGYSRVEIVVWKPRDDVKTQKADTELTLDKIIWRGSATVHDNRLTTDGSFFVDMFVRTTPAPTNADVVYSINDKDLTISLPDGVSLDEVAVTFTADAGDVTVLRKP